MTFKFLFIANGNDLTLRGMNLICFLLTQESKVISGEAQSVFVFTISINIEYRKSFQISFLLSYFKVVKQGCTGQHFFASGRGRRYFFRGGAGQGSKFTGRGGAGRGKGQTLPGRGIFGAGQKDRKTINQC